MRLQKKIDDTTVQKGQVALFFVAQAGFCIKTSSGKKIYIDLYLSDACERLFGFKRMIPTLMNADEVDADLYLITHFHADHFDPDAMPVIVKHLNTFFAVAPDCVSLLDKLAVDPSRYKVLSKGDEWQWEDVKIKAIYADHGDLAPDAVGYLIEVDGLKIYHVGDTAYKPQEIKNSVATNVDIMIAPINGTYGNMIAEEACRLAVDIQPRVLIPCHFWMFLEHVVTDGKGDPATFLKEAEQLPAGIKAMVMAPGECIIYSRD